MKTKLKFSHIVLRSPPGRSIRGVPSVSDRQHLQTKVYYLLFKILSRSLILISINTIMFGILFQRYLPKYCIILYSKFSTLLLKFPKHNDVFNTFLEIKFYFKPAWILSRYNKQLQLHIELNFTFY